MHTLRQIRIEEQTRAEVVPFGIGRIQRFAEWCAAIALVTVFVLSGLIPAWRTLNTDFPNYYVAARLYRQGTSLARAYEWIWFQREKDHLGIDQPLVGFMPNPPLCAVPVMPLSYLSPLSAKRIWLILNIAFLALTLWILHQNTNLEWRRLIFIAALCILPLQSNFICGQYYGLLLLLMTAAYGCARAGHRFTSGLLLAGAAALKLFPAVFLLLFLRKRDWRSAAGLLAGVAALAAVSIMVFGVDVHRVWLIEVLPRALRGDIIDPYALGWSSFSALWHGLFLFEPQLNPRPIGNLPIVYSLAQAATTTLLLFSFLGRDIGSRDRGSTALEWAAFVPLLLLLSSMPSPYHYCVLILPAIVGADILLNQGERRKAIVLIALFALACVPVPDWFAERLVLIRLFATLAFYLFLLSRMAPTARLQMNAGSLSAAIGVGGLLFASALTSTRGRTEDFNHRLAFVSPGYSAGNPVQIRSQLAFREMVNQGYEAMRLTGDQAVSYPVSGDVLSLTGRSQSAWAYFEQVGTASTIVRATETGQPLLVGAGENPVISNDGAQLLFTTRNGQFTSIWRVHTDLPTAPRKVLDTSENLMDVNFGPGETSVAAAGPASEPYLVSIVGGQIEAMPDVARPARYPVISPDGKNLAFTVRDHGAWQLMVHNVVNGAEIRLTDAPCNATEPFWQDNQTILYATDCGRGLGLTALARISLKTSR